MIRSAPFSILLACVGFGAPAHTQTAQLPYRAGGVIDLQQAVEDASNDWLVLLVASHPDDNYLMAAASLRFDYGFRVAVLLATRGEGGQNSEGPETGDALGRLRTREAEASAARLGIDVWYLNRPDGGYCRSAEEALSLWGREGTVRDMARLIRRTRPDIVLTTHHPEETHGNNLALLDILPSAVEQAGDVDVVTPGLPPFVVQRLFVGVAPEDRGDHLDAAIELEMNTMDLTRGATYRRLAYETLIDNHKSQQPFRPINEVYPEELRFVPVSLWGRPPSPGLYDGLRALWNLLPDVPANGLSRRDLVQALDVDLQDHLGNTSMLVDRALAIYASLQSIAREPGSELEVRLNRRLEALRRVIQYGCGLQVEVESEAGVAVPGEDLPLQVSIHNGEARVIEGLRMEAAGGGMLTLDGGAPDHGFVLGTRQGLSTRVTYRLPENQVGQGDLMGALYREVDFRWPVQLLVHYGIGGQEFTFPVEVPVEVRPPVEIICTPAQLLVPTNLLNLKFSLEVRRNSDAPVVGNLLVEAPAGFAVRRREGGDSTAVSMVEERGETFDFELTVPGTLRTGVSVLRFRLDGAVLNEARIHKVEVATDPALRVGLVRGVEKITEEALQGLGVQLTVLADEGLLTGNLQDFDSIVVDLRALRNRPRARAAFGRLLRFAMAGGRLVVFYHKDTEFNIQSAGFRGYPYQPFHIGRGRVTREDAPVRMLLPEHQVLRRPNRIGAADWDGWVQERGLYFPDEFAEEYRPLLAMADPGEKEELGALLYAEYGTGDFIYCALSLYRQLKNMHPGAVRLLANMITPR